MIEAVTEKKEKMVLSKSDKILKGEILLPGSKSLSNRALVLQALCKEKFIIHNLSEAEDTKILKSSIVSRQSYVDIGHAGTCMRFLTACFACREGEEVILTGSSRMKERPVKLLVDALRELGADIAYLENEGYPPLKILGKKLDKTSEISIAGNISSQYISALLMIGPTLPEGLTVTLQGEISSRPYIEMTLALMRQLGIQYSWIGHSIHVKKQEYQANDITIEPDWSAASYWYAMAALSDEVDLKLKNLDGYSLQGDSAIAEVMANFGVKSAFLPDGVHLSKIDKPLQRKIFDFKDCPDLAQTVIVCCAALRHSATFTGLESLKIKETNRVRALQNELGKIDAELIEKNLSYKLQCASDGIAHSDTITISTYNDHRMAMAFAPLAVVVGKIEIENPDVVGKSYPGFWQEMKKVRFEVN